MSTASTMVTSPLLGTPNPSNAILAVTFNTAGLVDYLGAMNNRQVNIAIEYALNTILNPAILSGKQGSSPEDPENWENVEENLRTNALHLMYEAADDADKIMADFTYAALEIAYDDLVTKLSEDITADNDNVDVMCLYNDFFSIKWLDLLDCSYIQDQGMLHTALLIRYNTH